MAELAKKIHRYTLRAPVVSRALDLLAARRLE